MHWLYPLTKWELRAQLELDQAQARKSKTKRTLRWSTFSPFFVLTCVSVISITNKNLRKKGAKGLLIQLIFHLWSYLIKTNSKSFHWQEQSRSIALGVFAFVRSKLLKHSIGFFSSRTNWKLAPPSESAGLQSKWQDCKKDKRLRKISTLSFKP